MSIIVTGITTDGHKAMEMNTYTFADTTIDRQRTGVVIALRRAGCFAVKAGFV